MQPVSRKNYFLLACLIAFVVIILGAAGKMMLGGYSHAPSTLVYNSKMGYNSTDSYLVAPPAPAANSLGSTMMRDENAKIAADGVAPAPDMLMPIRPTDPAPVTGTDRKIIKNGNVGIVVKNVDESTKSIEEKAKQLGGYLSSTNISTSGNNAKSGYVSARIPVDRVNDFLAYLRSSSVKVTNENINSDDVTSEFIDLQAKISNSEATAAQYRELLKRAVKVDEVLEVQRELNSIQTQIDSYKGQLKYLEGNAALSNITVNLAVDEGELPIAPENKWQPANVFKASVRGLTVLAQNISYAAIMIAVYAIVWVPVCLGLFLLYKILRKKIR